MSSRNRIALALLVFAALPAQAQAQAQPSGDASASLSLYHEGRKLYDASQFALACPKFEASLRLSPDDLDVNGMLGLCYEQLGKLASAWTQFRDLSARAEAAKRDEHRKVALDKIAALAPRVAKVTLATPATPGLIVKRDGIAVPGGELAVDAGALVISAEAPGFVSWRQEITIRDGETRAVEIPALTAVRVTVTPPPPPPPPPPQQPTASPKQRWIAIGLAGAGGVALGVGAWAGLDARDKRARARSAGCNADFSMCPPAALPTAEAAFARGHLADAMFVGGGVLVGAAVVVWLLAPRGEKRSAMSWRIEPRVDPTGVAVAIGGSL